MRKRFVGSHALEGRFAGTAAVKTQVAAIAAGLAAACKDHRVVGEGLLASPACACGWRLEKSGQEVVERQTESGGRMGTRDVQLSKRTAVAPTGKAVSSWITML